MQIAPKTVAHIFKLCAMGAYISNHFFRVDKGFVAQTADIRGGRTIRMNAEQQVGTRRPAAAALHDARVW